MCKAFITKIVWHPENSKLMSIDERTLFVKKRFITGLICSGILFLGAYVSAETGSKPTPIEKEEVNFENATLIDSQIDE